MSHSNGATDFYAILGVPPVASEEQIKAAYRHLVRLHHPDANPERREAAEIIIKRIIEAYNVLGNTQKRANYDSHLRLGAIENAQTRHQAAQHRSHGEPESLMGRVRWSLGIAPHEFAARLGLSDAVLLEMEGRDLIPVTPVQRRTFVNLCQRAAQKLDDQGHHSDADDLRADLRRKDAQNQFAR